MIGRLSRDFLEMNTGLTGARCGFARHSMFFKIVASSNSVS